MRPEARAWTEILSTARARLLATGSLDEESGPSAEILRSWRRSYDDGASTSDLESPYDDNVNLASRLVRAAEPVIGRVHEDVLGSPISVVLADSRGKVLLRRSGERSLEGRLDAAHLAPGFSYAERYVGTNGIGTALEARTPSWVRGAEHFNEALQVFACVGVPLKDPVTRRQLGVLDITTWADHANPALTALVRQAARVIEEGLLELSSRGSRTVLDAYLVASRGREDHVLAVGADALIGSTAAERRLGDVPREELWALAAGTLSHQDQAEMPLLTSSGETLRLQMRAVRSPQGGLVGAVLEFAEAPRRGPVVPAPHAVAEGLAAFAGLSPVTMGPAVMVSRLAAARQTASLVGENGVGRRTIVESAVARHLPGRFLTVVDGADEGASELADRVRVLLADGHPVLVRNAESLPAGVATALVSAPGVQTSGWLVFALRTPETTDQSGAQRELSTAGIPIVVVPPLRARVHDLREIVPKMVARLSGGRVTSVTPELLARLMREPWPGNLAEVERVLHTMLASASGRTLDVTHLPEGFGAGVRRDLSPMEWMAREAIVEALRGCGGDKARAAESLGISRASIYRKIKAYDISLSAG